MCSVCPNLKEEVEAHSEAETGEEVALQEEATTIVAKEGNALTAGIILMLEVKNVQRRGKDAARATSTTTSKRSAAQHLKSTCSTPAKKVPTSWEVYTTSTMKNHHGALP